MPDFKTAIILHATYYLQVADKLNDGYLRGGDEQVSSLKNFDIDFPNFITARNKLIAMIS